MCLVDRDRCRDVCVVGECVWKAGRNEEACADVSHAMNEAPGGVILGQFQCRLHRRFG